MTQVLGYDRFAAQGGDWRAFVTSRIVLEPPEHLIGLHLNLLPLERDTVAVRGPTPEKARYLEELRTFLSEETGYQWIQGTRPQTLAHALNGSSVGLVAWMVEKFWVWTIAAATLSRRCALTTSWPIFRSTALLVHGVYRRVVPPLPRPRA